MIYYKQMLTSRYAVGNVQREVNTPTDDHDEPVNADDSDDTVRLCRESATDYQPIPNDETQFTSNEQDDLAIEINETDNLT